MATRVRLKNELFKNGACPDESAYAEVFDSTLNLTDDRISPPDGLGNPLTISPKGGTKEALKVNGKIRINTSQGVPNIVLGEDRVILLSNGGNVGIGTGAFDTPEAILEIKTRVNNKLLQFSTNKPWYFMEGDDDALILKSSGRSGFRISNHVNQAYINFMSYSNGNNRITIAPYATKVLVGNGDPDEIAILSVNGMVASIDKQGGGYKFPDDTVQVTSLNQGLFKYPFIPIPFSISYMPISGDGDYAQAMPFSIFCFIDEVNNPGEVNGYFGVGTIKDCEEGRYMGGMKILPPKGAKKIKKIGLTYEDENKTVKLYLLTSTYFQFTFYKSCSSPSNYINIDLEIQSHSIFVILSYDNNDVGNPIRINDLFITFE